MRTGLPQLKTLRHRSIREFKVRGGQELAKLRDRLAGSAGEEMPDRDFLRCISPEARGHSAEETARLIAGRIRSRGLPNSLRSRREIVETMAERFGPERKAIISRADGAVEGHFDLLGFKNLSFGNPPDWLLEPLTDKRSSLDHWSRIDYLDPAVVGDKKITWELNRHQHFVTLGQAYWMTDDDAYARAFVAQATSWMDANPPNRGINWVSSLELSLRTISWLWALRLFAGSAWITDRFVLRVLKHLVAHGVHIKDYLSHYFSPNTHLTGEALGLFYLGTALPELSHAKDWRVLGQSVLVDQLNRQIRSDGVYFEQATYYHRYTADFYTHLLILARAARIALPASVEQTLEMMISHLMFIQSPDGSSPLMGDDEGGRLIVLGPRETDDFRDTLATAAALLGRSDWKRASGQAAVETLWLLSAEGLARFDELPDTEPHSASRVFQASGCSVLRDGWSKDSTYAMMDCGPHGSLSHGHAHADALSIQFAALGKTWIVDPGTFTYTADRQMRDWFRSTEAHNTITVDGESQSIPAGPFSWSRIARTTFDDHIIGGCVDYVAGSHDGYERLADPVRHSRTVTFPKLLAGEKPGASLPSYLIVSDSLASTGNHSYAIAYHLAPGCSAFASGTSVLATEPSGSRLHITAFGHPTLRARIIEGWVSRAYGQRERAPVVVFLAEGEGPQEFTTFIIPTTADQSVRVEEQQVNSGLGRAFKITSAELCDVFVSSEGIHRVTSLPVTVTARMAWARFINQSFARAFMVDGRTFETRDGIAVRSAAPVKHCELRRTANGIECSIAGDSLISLADGLPALTTLVNGSSFELEHTWESVRPARMHTNEKDGGTARPRSQGTLERL